MILGLGSAQTVVQCSRTGCQQEASVQIFWRNPKIHTGDRKKIWLSCDEHQEYLSKFLALRGFLLTVEPFAAEHNSTQTETNA